MSADEIRPEDIPADLIDKVHPVALQHGIPWHDDAVRIVAAAVLTEARARIATAIKEHGDAQGLDCWCQDTYAEIASAWPEVAE